MTWKVISRNERASNAICKTLTHYRPARFSGFDKTQQETVKPLATNANKTNPAQSPTSQKYRYYRYSQLPSCAHQGQFGNSTTLRQPNPYPPTTVLSSVFILFIFRSPGILFLLPAKENFNSPYKERLGSNNRSECYIIQLFEKKRKTPNAALSLQSALGKMGKKMFKVKFCRQM